MQDQFEITWDRTHNLGYIYTKPKVRGQARLVSRSEQRTFDGMDFVIDYDATGEVCGVELLNAFPAMSSIAAVLRDLEVE